MNLADNLPQTQMEFYGSAYIVLSKYWNAIEGPIVTVMAAHKGVPAAAFYDVVILYGQKEKLAQLFDTSLKTFKRHAEENKNLSPANGEMVLKMIALFKKGLEVFGDPEALKRWLAKPAFGLGNLLPFDLMKTSDGIDLIVEELMRIEYGDLA